ncbi:hypothetical protein [Phaeodactylibacter luteus]|uniref:PorT family protein n=1 Tax=Phaeodactylibacter luteus TaxID=1564516 RepID=A0A5C6RG50_9BACT|nr:hypothetical protein [Phaeodactylibacter luteus]TXB60635.1 hypothetical protein FRY97_20145 [Phaeodactylibacter luteus]
MNYLMKKYQLLTIIIVAFFATHGYSQNEGIGFYFQPEYSAMFLPGHVGNAVGIGIGITSKNRKWDFGIRTYGRSGPINTGQLYDLVLAEGVTYKGKSVLQVANDHGFLGLEMAYNLKLKSDRLMLRFPVAFGSFGAGFYLLGEDRITPDGRRVNEWEDELQGGNDAGFGWLSEIGCQMVYQLIPDNSHLNIFAGLTHTTTYGYESFLGDEDLYNNRLRASVGIRVGF